MAAEAAAVAAGGAAVSNASKVLARKIELLESAVSDADNGAITNARKMDGLCALGDCIPALQRPDIVKQQLKVEEIVERLLAQNATEPLRRLAVSVLNKLYKHGDSSALPTFASKLLRVTGEQNKKIANDTRVAMLDVIGELVVQHGRALEAFSTDIFVIVAKHMKFPEASARCAAFSCLCKTVSVSGLKSPSVAGNIWKMVQKMLLDKVVTVRTAAAHALTALASASPASAHANGSDMAAACLKVLSSEDPSNMASGLASECRFAFACALAQVLGAMATPAAMAMADRPKKKPVVTDFASALEFLEQSVGKGSSHSAANASLRAAICLSAVKLAEVLGISDFASLVSVAKTILNIIDIPPSSKGKAAVADEDALAYVAQHAGHCLRYLLLLLDSEAGLLDFIEQGLLQWASAQFSESSRSPSADARMVVVLETLCSACIAAGETFGGVESKVKQPLLHVVGSYPNPLVQLHATYCMRVVANSSPGQLFQLMSVLLNHVTVLNAEMLGAPTQRRRDGASTGNPSSTESLQPLLRGLFGNCAALAALAGELFHSNLGVPHDVTSAVLGTSRALLQPHPNPVASAQRRICAFLLLEGLMCLGTDWVGQRLTTLFALWKAALGKKPVDRARALYQQHAAAPQSENNAGLDSSYSACRDELLSLYFALRSLQAFTQHSRETLLTSLPHLHKILVVFLTNISQLIVALPHPTSASLRAKYKGDCPKSMITLSSNCGLPEVLLMMRSTMYQTFAAMLPSQYSSRFVPLLNMLADDVTRTLPSDFPMAEFLAQYTHTDDALLDLVDPYSETGKDVSTTVRLVMSKLSTTAANGELPKDAMSDVTSTSYFSSPSREGSASSNIMLTPWDAWFNPARPMSEHCASAEWEWRRSAIELLAIVMNSGDVSEQARTAVLAHLLKRRDGPEEGGAAHSKKSAATAPAGDIGVIPTIAVFAYLREHARTRGAKCAPPSEPMEQVLRLSVEGMKEANPAVRRLHVELVSLLCFVHHRQTDSPIVPRIIQQLGTDASSELTPVRSSVALLCGAILRTFACGGAVGGEAVPCPHIAAIVPALIRLAKETSQPVRLWMLYAIHLSMRAAKSDFAPFLKDTLRLATAHLLADFFESPLVLWVIAELARSATAACLQSENLEADIHQESVSRILGMWNELKHVRYVGTGSGAAFATVCTEAVSVSTASMVVQLSPFAPRQLTDLVELVSLKLQPPDLGGSTACAVRAAAARCLTELLPLQAGLPSDTAVVQEPVQLFMLLERASCTESEALKALILRLIESRGLRQLPMWLQTLKEIVLALPPKSSVAEPPLGDKAVRRSNSEDGGGQDEHDDGASMAAPQAEPASGSTPYRAPRSATKIFAVRCVRLLLEQPAADDPAHFQVEMSSSQGARDAGRFATQSTRMVSHLDTLMGLAAHGCSSDEKSLAEAGLALMALVVRRFRHTRDVHGQEDVEHCPLLLVQFEAQIAASIRHNMRPEATPATTCLALELLRDVILARACNSTQRLIAMLAQPFASPVFEPDPLFCEFASTRCFLQRLRCACEILDTEQPDGNGMLAHLGDLGLWIELALRDCAVSLAGLPLQSLKTYKPSCFSLADYKAMQPCFREAVASLLRGACALCAQLGQGSGAAAAPADLPQLAMGVAVLVLGDQKAPPSDADSSVYLRTARQMLLYASGAGSSAAGEVVTRQHLLDLFGRIWQSVARDPARLSPQLGELVELVHTVSRELWHGRRTKEPAPAARDGEAAWSDGMRDGTPEASSSLAVLGAYVFQVVALALRDPALTEDVARVSQALEVLVWWLLSSLRDAADKRKGSIEDAKDDAEDEDEAELVAAALSADQAITEQSAPAAERCPWLWLSFQSPFPVGLMRMHAAVTLKHWRSVCTILSSGQLAGCGDDRLRYLALMSGRLSKLLLDELGRSAEPLTPEDERQVVYLFALLVPAVSALCAVLQQTTSGGREAGKMPFGAVVSKCMRDVQEVLSQGSSHSSAKISQTAVSSLQSLLQSGSPLVLSCIALPGLVRAVVQQPPSLQGGVIDTAWAVLSTMLAGQPTTEDAAFTEVSTHTAVGLIAALAEYTLASPASYAAQQPAMAQCLLQVARTDQPGLKREIAALSPEGQQIVQRLLREHVAVHAAAPGSGADRGGAVAAPKAKIELKLKF